MYFCSKNEVREVLLVLGEDDYSYDLSINFLLLIKYILPEQKRCCLIERVSTKDLLVKSLKDLAKTKFIDKITVKEIADNCGLSKRTFYQYFQDKSELILYEYSKI